jgi:hypothetical protein
MKTKIFLILIGIIGLLAGITFSQFKKVNKLKKDNERIYDNFIETTREVHKVRTENGTLHASINSLNLHFKEAQEFNGQLLQKVSDLNIKLKHAQSVKKVEYVYIYVIDSTKITKVNDTTFLSNYTDEWLSLNQRITLTEEKSNILIDSLNIELRDNLYIVDEILYKRRWIFWKRPVGVKIHVTSDNPHLDIDKIESINLLKK